MYKIQKEGPFYTSLSYLRKMRQIPASASKNYMKVFNTISVLSKVISFFCTAVGPVMHLIISIITHSSKDRTEEISIFLGASGGGIVSLLFTLKYKEWSDFFKELVDTKEYGRPPTLTDTAKRLNRLAKICLFSASWVTIVYATAAWYSSAGCQEMDEHDRFGQICPSFIPIWLPFGTNDITAGTIVFVLQTFFVGVIVAQAFLTECYVMYESTEVLTCHVDYLKDLLKEAFEAQSILGVRGRLRYCINYHVHILKMGYRLNTLIKYTAGHMSLLSALVCGCVANQMLNTKPMGSFIFLAAWLFALLCFCHSGQRIKDSTMSVADAIWDSKWYNTDVKTRKDVQFILLRCQKPVCLEALPMGVTDYPFYFMMIKTGYSFFALFHKSL